MENDMANHEAKDSKPLKYLTVQDVLWINLELTKKVRHFRFAKLEEATYYQYGYGGSRDLALQAGRFLSGFMKLRPLDAGNEATAFVGAVAFLFLNGARLSVSDSEGAEWVEQVRTGKIRAEESLPISMCPCHGEGAKVADAVADVLGLFPKTIAELLNHDESLAAS